MRMNHMTLTLLAAGIAASAEWTRSRSPGHGVAPAGIQHLRDRAAVAGGAH
jgi:hypothetical protein